MKKWIITFTIDAPLSNGFAIVFAKNPKEAEQMVKQHSRFKDERYKIQSIEEYAYDGCVPGVIIAEGIVQEGGVFTPHIDKNGVLSWTNNAGYKNPESIVIKGKDGKDGKDGAPGIQGLQGPEGKQGPRGIEGQRGPEGPTGKPGVQYVESEEEITEDTNMAILDAEDQAVFLLTDEDLKDLYTKNELIFNYDSSSKTLNIDLKSYGTTV